MPSTVGRSLDRYKRRYGFFRIKVGDVYARDVTELLETRETTAPATAGELLDLVRSGRAVTRSQLRALTGLSRTAVTARVTSLTTAGLLLLGEELASTGGRPPGALVFNKDAGVVLAVAVGRSRSQLAVLDLDGQEIASDSRDHEVGVGPDELLPEVGARLVRLLDGPCSASA
jgi:hypothetical protein